MKVLNEDVSSKHFFLALLSFRRRSERRSLSPKVIHKEYVIALLLLARLGSRPASG